jgi:hypothetical protein
MSGSKNVKADLAREKVQRVREALKHLDEIERLLKLLLKRQDHVGGVSDDRGTLESLRKEALREYGEAKLAEEEP